MDKVCIIVTLYQSKSTIDYLLKEIDRFANTNPPFEPEFIFYLSGVDIIENDKLGRLSVSLDGCKQRDKFVLNYCKKNGIPLQISMGGGYSPEISVIVEAHANTFRLAQEIYF